MLNFKSEQKLNKTFKNIGFISFSPFSAQIMENLGQIPETKIKGAFSEEIVEKNASFNFTKNPFGLINESDIIVVSNNDKKSYNLIIESILNSCQIIISNPFSFEIEEYNYLEKLGQEASVNLLAYNSFDNWDLIEKLSFFGKKSIHIEIDTFLGIDSNSNMEIKQRLFEILYLLHSTTGSYVKKFAINNIPFQGLKNGIIKIWLELENSAVTIVTLHCISEKNTTNFQFFLNDKLIKGNSFENCYEICTNSKTIIEECPGEPILNHIIKKFTLGNQNWFENQQNYFIKSLLLFHKLIPKIPFNKK